MSQVQEMDVNSTDEGQNRIFPGLTGLSTKHLGRSLKWLTDTTSTSDVARRDALKGAPHGHIVLAEHQTSGRGRKGRAWEAPRGKNLSFSLVLRPDLPLEDVPSLTLCAAVGMRRGLLAEGVDVGIKWPNDLLFQGRKLCGILSEMSLSPHHPGRVDHVIIGIGLNVNLDVSTLPPPLDETAISLKAIAGRDWDRERLLETLLLHLESTLESDFATLREEYIRGSSTMGSRVRAIMESGTVEGIATSLDGKGALVLRLDDGSSTTVVAGDVEHLRRV